MDNKFLDIMRSLRHSRIRRDTARSLCRRRRAYLQQIAEDVKTDVWTVRAALSGAMPYYSVDASLVALQLVRSGTRKGLEYFEITPLGDRVVATMPDLVS